MMNTTLSFCTLLLLAAGCGEDELYRFEPPDISIPPEPVLPPPPPPGPAPSLPLPQTQEPCIEEQTAFDIEEVSVLEDAFALPNLRDAIVLDNQIQNLGQDDSWRVKSVDVLVMIPESAFTYYPDNVDLTIEVFDAESPLNSAPYKKRQSLRKSDLQWDTVTLTNPATAFDRRQKRAWWRFDFSDVIPESGMHADRYIVGVNWSLEGEPTVGYSNYNRSCSRNWTNSGFGFRNNGDNHPNNDNECSWPMMRVTVETRSYNAVDCD